MPALAFLHHSLPPHLVPFTHDTPTLPELNWKTTEQSVEVDSAELGGMLQAGIFLGYNMVLG